MNTSQKASAARLRQAAAQIARLAPLELKRSSRQRKHDMENAYATPSRQASTLHLQVSPLSTAFNPQQYLEHAQDLLGQLARLDALTHSEPSAFEGQDWRVQPEDSAEIDYQAFQRVYEFSPGEIDGLITLLQQYYPGTPIENRTVEWAVLTQRDMEGQNVLAHAFTHSAWATRTPCQAR